MELTEKVMVAIRKPIESLNTLKNWAKRHRISKCWEQEIWAALNGRVPQAKGRVKVSVLSLRARLLDDDNLIGGAKGLRDALKRLGLIVNDSPKWADFVYAQKQQSIGGYTIIEIDPL